MRRGNLSAEVQRKAKSQFGNGLRENRARGDYMNAASKQRVIGRVIDQI